MRVTIQEINGTENELLLPSDEELVRVIPAIVNQLGLPLTQSGRSLKYELEHMGRRERLQVAATLKDNGVQEGDRLLLLAHPRAA